MDFFGFRVWGCLLRLMGCACMGFSGFGHRAEGFQKFQLRAQEAEGCKAFVEWRALGM